MAAEFATNFRDSGEWVNLILGEQRLKVDVLYRGGSIKDCFTACEIQNPDLIICLKRSVDKPDWASTVHAPTSNTLDCYKCDNWQVRRWISQVVSGIIQADPKRMYIHCHSGRDRTGVIVAAILNVLGVPSSAIKEEYRLSSGSDEALFSEALQKLGDCSWVVESERQALRHMLLSA